MLQWKIEDKNAASRDKHYVENRERIPEVHTLFEGPTILCKLHVYKTKQLYIEKFVRRDR